MRDRDQCCSHHFATLYRAPYTDPFNHFLSLFDTLSPDLVPFFTCSIISVTQMTPQWLLVTFIIFSSPVYDFFHECVGSLNHIIKQLFLDEFKTCQKMTSATLISSWFEITFSLLAMVPWLTFRSEPPTRKFPYQTIYSSSSYVVLSVYPFCLLTSMWPSQRWSSLGTLQESLLSQTTQQYSQPVQILAGLKPHLKCHRRTNWLFTSPHGPHH